MQFAKMIRLSLITLVAIWATLLVFGDREGGEVAVTRAALDEGALPSAAAGGSEPVATSTPGARTSGTPKADISAREAVQMALEAESLAEPEAPPGPDAQGTGDAPELDIWYVTGNRVNLRAGPSTSEAVIGEMNLGDTAELLSEPGADWLRIRTEAGREGYIFGRFLDARKPV